MQENNFWQTNRGKSVIKLGAWIIFIVIILVLSVFGKDNNYNNVIDENQNETEEVIYEFVNYSDMQKELLKNNYEYEYIIKSNDNIIIFNGVKDGTSEMGYKEDNNGIIKYYIDNLGVKQVILNDMVELNTLYDNIDSSFLDLEILFNNLNEYLYNIEKNGNERTIMYDKEGFSVVVKTDLNNIKNINIINNEVTYELKFTNIGKCDKLGLSVS